MGQIVVYKEKQAHALPGSTLDGRKARRKGMRRAGKMVNGNYKKSYKKAVRKTLKDLIDGDFDVRFEYTANDGLGDVTTSLRLDRLTMDGYPLYVYSDAAKTPVAHLELDIRNERDKDSDDVFHMRVTGPRREKNMAQNPFEYLSQITGDLAEAELNTQERKDNYMLAALSFQRCL